MLQWTPTIREGFGFRMRTITKQDFEPLDVFRRGLPAPSLTATRSYAPKACGEAADKREAFKQDPPAQQGRVGKGTVAGGLPSPLRPPCSGKGGFCAEGAYGRFASKGREPLVPSTVGSLLNREYENTVDTIVQRTREQERIVREWDIEMERLLERQYRMNYDDVVREFNHKVREYCL